MCTRPEISRWAVFGDAAPRRGLSFGAAVGLRSGCEDSRVSELFGLGFPVHDLDAGYLPACTKSKLLIQSSEDRYSSKENWERLLAAFSAEQASATQVAFVRGADHFFSDHIDEMTRALSNWLVQRHPLLRPVESQ